MPTTSTTSTVSIWDRVCREVREIGLVTIYFLACFLLFLSLKKLVLAEYQLEITILGTAVISALVVAKVVVLLGKTSFGNTFESQRLALHVLWRTLLYTTAVFLVTLAERLFDLYREEGTLGAAMSKLWAGEKMDHFLAMNITIGLSLLVYNVYGEIDRHFGEGSLRRLFFSRRAEVARGDPGVGSGEEPGASRPGSPS